MIVLYIAIFGALGCLTRYYLQGWTQNVLGGVLPYGTFAVNILGSFLIGLVMEFSLSSEIVSPSLRAGLTIGLLGGMTTFSSFSYETYRLLEDGEILYALLNVFGSVSLCILFTGCGFLTARHLL